MVLTLHTVPNGEEIEVNFTDVHTMIPSRSWEATQIRMRNGETITVEEPADEIMERLAGKEIE